MGKRVFKPIEYYYAGEHCPACAKGMIVEKRGKYGKFYACNRFPKCCYKLRRTLPVYNAKIK
jgi:ssDNA-binding Zn-finger/Zn-ribbon topoisomerase 1